MKTILLLTLALFFTGCAINHKRGSDAQLTVDYYLKNRGDLPSQLTKLVNLKNTKEASVTLQWTVNDSGETKDVAVIQDNLHNEAVNTVLVEHLKSMSFPKQPRFTTTTVEYTYKFHLQQNQ